MQIRRWHQPVMLLTLVTVSVLAVACGSGEAREGASRTGTSASSKDQEATTIAISAKDNLFEPKELTVERGHAVTFNIKNDGQAIHNLHIVSTTTEGKDFLSRSTTIQPGESSTLTATFTKAATLKFQCDFHLPDMVGTLTVK